MMHGGEKILGIDPTQLFAIEVNVDGPRHGIE
mgnify:CR=1 FL=1